MQSPDQ